MPSRGASSGWWDEHEDWSTPRATVRPGVRIVANAGVEPAPSGENRAGAGHVPVHEAGRQQQRRGVQRLLSGLGPLSPIRTAWNRWPRRSMPPPDADGTHEDFPVTRYRDIGAVVYELRAVSWQVPGFDVAMFDKQLREIDAQTASPAASQSEATDS